MALKRRRSGRKKKREIVIPDPSVCYNCERSGLGEKELYCPDCGFPQGKGETEQKQFIVQQRKKRSELDEMKANIGRAQNFLYALGAINLLYLMVPDLFTRITSGVLGASFLVLAYFTPKRPFITLLTALIAYGSLSLLDLILNPLGAILGIAFKVIIIGGLVFGLNAASKAEKLRKELENVQLR